MIMIMYKLRVPTMCGIVMATISLSHMDLPFMDVLTGEYYKLHLQKCYYNNYV